MFKKGYVPWNKGLTKETDERVARNARKISESMAGNLNLTGKGSTEEIEKLRRERISESMKKNPIAGGRRQGSGRGKQGWYKGYWCDSSWELAFVIYNLEHGILFKRNERKFYYKFEGRQHYWLPDFLMANGMYIEIKGYETAQSEKKHNSFKGYLIVLREKEMAPYLKYVIEKYRENFYSLYDDGGSIRRGD